jgi:methionyl-tRNA formyltransferase
VTALRVAFAGTPQFAVPALAALLSSPHTIVGVLTQPDRPSGRGRRILPGPVKTCALQAGLPVSQPAGLKTATEQAALLHWRPDVLVVVAYGVILPPAVLAIPPCGCINIHASLLPRWRGAAPIQRAIQAGDAQSGVTIMQMDAGLDTGPMLLQQSTRIGASETAGQLQERLAEQGAQALLQVLDQLAGGPLAARAQPVTGVTYAAKISKGEALIDWQQDAALIDRQIRAFNPVPGAQTRLQGEQLKIHAARPEPSRSEPQAASAASFPPGSIIEVRRDAIVVACGRGRLAVTEVQRPGRKPVGAGTLASGISLPGLTLG